MADKVVAKGRYFKAQLQKLAAKYPDKVKEVRGEGLLLGMDLKKKGGQVVTACLDKGLIVNCTADTVIRLVPPLIVTEKEIDEAVAILDKGKALAKF
jgi:acetylornithine/N-succinyldiaminopimelate aminotransferase